MLEIVQTEPEHPSATAPSESSPTAGASQSPAPTHGQTWLKTPHIGQTRIIATSFASWRQGLRFASSLKTLWSQILDGTFTFLGPHDCCTLSLC